MNESNTDRQRVSRALRRDAMWLVLFLQLNAYGVLFGWMFELLPLVVVGSIGSGASLQALGSRFAKVFVVSVRSEAAERKVDSAHD